MGACCSVGDSSEEGSAAYHRSGSKPRQRADYHKSGLSGASGGNGGNSPGLGGSNAGTSYSQRASFVYPKMPNLPKRTQIDSPSGSRKPTDSASTVSETKIKNLFDKYREKSYPDLILIEGIVKFCGDLSLSPEDFLVLVLAWHFNAAQMGRFTREEFCTGCKKLRVDSVKQLAARLPELARALDNPACFKTFYRWSYQFALDSEVGQRILSLDVAVQLWRLVFTNRPPPVLENFLKFLQKTSPGAAHSTRGISRDTWNMFLHFVDTVGDRFDTYSSEEAWPSLIDDFVEYETANLSEGWRFVSQSRASSRPLSSTSQPAASKQGGGVLEDVE